MIDALAVDPNNPRALVALASLREQAGDPGQAVANYSRALAIDPAQPTVAARVAAIQSAPPGQRTAAVPQPALPPPSQAFVPAPPGSLAR